MRNLNFQHLEYFWTVANEGQVTSAARKLRLAQPTISSQVKTLEDHLGSKLFLRDGKKLQLTEAGKVAYRYADQIFGLGKEMLDIIEGRPDAGPMVVHVGIADILPKRVTYKLLEPAMNMKEDVRVICHENRPEKLLADLSTNRIDIIFSDSPMSPTFKTKTYNHHLGECGLSFFATADLAKKYAKDFPFSLNEAPMVVPTENSNLRVSLNYWFRENGIEPYIVGEFEDSALLKLFGKNGQGIFAVTTLVEQQFIDKGLVLLGRVDSIKERLYAISMERQIKHPAVVAIVEAARASLFQGEGLKKANG